MTHTPGPWKLQNVIASDRHTLVYKRIIAKGIKEAIAFAGVYKGHNAEANAQLIAAAPELLDACIDALEILKVYGPGPCATISKLEDAIAKAKAES